MSNVYGDLCLKVQALRREFEGLRTPMAPAIGVGASIYTHQMANVHRVLTDVRVRHLLADEVGLGKTIQALMILNALRHRRQDIRALVIVPDRLVTQWRDEILTRAHSVPIGHDDEGEGNQYIKLAWEGQLSMTTSRGNAKWRLSDIDPDRYEVLVVDELHRLTARVQDRIVRVAGGFEHLLLLTATPAFHDAQKHAQLMTMLEPERSQRPGLSDGLGRDVVEHLLEWDRSAALAGTPQDLVRVSLAHCAYRRVIRTRRADYPNVLPRRKHLPVLTEPLGAEQERQALMWKYFGHLGELTLEVEPVKLAKRVVLSPPSLEQRVDFLRRKGHDRRGLLERAKPLVYRGKGDSRADALVDLLAEIWTRDHSERVLVGAQDNLTVDYLFDIITARLPLIGPFGRRVPLLAARIRQGMMTEAVEDLSGYGNETHENLEAFQRGQAQVLFAPDAAQVGLNLQCSRILVLYSVPWKPEEVEQWIGRLDRIGNSAAFAEDGEAKTIDIYTIAQKGLVDEKVVTVLRRFHTFERSVNLDGSHLEDVARSIETAALKPENTDWRSLEDATEAMAAEDEVKQPGSQLHGHLPWTAEWASALRRQLEALPPAPFAVSRSELAVSGPRSWDRGVEGMLKLLGRAHEYSFRWNSDPNGGRFLSLWYRFGERGTDGRKSVRSKVVFTFGADPGSQRSPRNAHAFITRRGDITAPPRRHVTLVLEDGEEAIRPLQFVNFGNALHDEIVEGWLPKKTERFSVDVTLPQHHTTSDRNWASIYLVRLAVLDPAAWLEAGRVCERALRVIAAAATCTPLERLSDVMHPFTKSVRCGIEADVRWLRAQIAAQFRVQGLKVQGRRWIGVGIDEVSALLDPLIHAARGIPASTELEQPERLSNAVESALGSLRSADRRVVGTCWQSQLPDLDSALQLRLFVIGEEAKDAVAVAEAELASAEAELRLTLDQGNQAQITRATKARDAAADKAEMTRTLWRERQCWLAGCREAVEKTVPEERITAVLRVRRAA